MSRPWRLGGWRRGLGRGLALALVLLCAAPLVAWAANLSWTARASMPTARAALGVATGSDGTLYAVGGSGAYNGSSFPILGTVEAYSPTTNTWATKTSMSTAREYLGVAASGGKVYAIGGWDGSSVVGTVEAYDPSSNTWATKASLPTPRYMLGVAASGGRIYAIGGESAASAELSTVEAYDPKTDAWTAKTPMPTPRWLLALATGSDGKIYAIGGRSNSSPTIAMVEAYDPKTDTWATKTSMPTPRFGLGAATSGGSVYAIGGLTDSLTVLQLATVEAYNPKSDKWTSQTGLTTARKYPGVATGSDGTLYAVGGMEQTPTIVMLNTVEAAKPLGQPGQARGGKP